MKPAIVIVGAGPSGSVLALVLLHHGIPVRLIESTAAHPLAQWHSTSILPRCLELFTMLGVADDILEHAIRVPAIQHYKSSDRTKVDVEFEMSPYTEPTSASPFLNVVLLSQVRLEKILHAELARKGCPVEKGVELSSFEQSSECVNVKLIKRNGRRLEYEEASYEWMVGADGAASMVCDRLGVEFYENTTEKEQMVVGDIVVEDISPHSWHLWGSKPPSSHVSLRGTEDPHIFTFNINGNRINHADLCKDEERLKAFLQENTGKKFGDIIWSAVYDAYPRVASKFSVGRVLVSGVATSRFPPQALTSAVQDAYNIAWKLALIHRKLAPFSLLGSYTEERLPVVAEMMDVTFKKGRVSFRDKKGRDDIKKSSYDQLGVNCRWSSIVYDERKKDDREDQEDSLDYDFDDFEDDSEEVFDAYGLEMDGALTAGDRAPEAIGLVDARDSRKTKVQAKTFRLLRIFGPSYHTVLVFAESTRRWPSVLRTLALYPKGTLLSVLISRPGNLVPTQEADYADWYFEDHDGNAHDIYLQDDKYGIVIVRPDGVVGAIVKGIEGVNWYFHGIFAQRGRN